MAKLRADLNTSRMDRRGSEVHRLGDTWVNAEVASWDYRLETYLDDEGICGVRVRNLHSGHSVLLYEGPITCLASGSARMVIPEPVKAIKPKKPRKSVLEQDMSTWLKEEAG